MSNKTPKPLKTGARAACALFLLSARTRTKVHARPGVWSPKRSQEPGTAGHGRQAQRAPHDRAGALDLVGTLHEDARQEERGAALDVCCGGHGPSYRQAAPRALGPARKYLSWSMRRSGSDCSCGFPRGVTDIRRVEQGRDRGYGLPQLWGRSLLGRICGRYTNGPVSDHDVDHSPRVRFLVRRPMTRL